MRGWTFRARTVFYLDLRDFARNFQYYLDFFQPLVREIDHPSTSVGVRSALHSVIALGNEAGMGNGSGSKLGNATCSLLAKEGCVKALLKQCNFNHQKCQDVRILALRGLSAICCVAECIRELEKVSI